MPLPNYDRDRELLLGLIGDCVWDKYRQWFNDGGSEPVVTAARILDWIIANNKMPGRFRNYDREGQIDAVRSAIRTEVNGGRIWKVSINAGTATERTAYSPVRLEGQTWTDVFGSQCKRCGRMFKSLPTDDVCDNCRVDLEPEVT